VNTEREIDESGNQKKEVVKDQIREVVLARDNESQEQATDQQVA